MDLLRDPRRGGRYRELNGETRPLAETAARIGYSKAGLKKLNATAQGAIYPILKLRRRLPPVTARADSPATNWAAITICPVCMREG